MNGSHCLQLAPASRLASMLGREDMPSASLAA